MTDAEKIEALKANLANLDEKGRKFADSLLGYWDKNSFLSRKQWYWVERLAAPKQERKQSKRKAKEQAPQADPRFEAMVAAFRNANAGQRKRVMRAIHPDHWEGASWATELFQAANL
jgi:hypothetical protein